MHEELIEKNTLVILQVYIDRKDFVRDCRGLASEERTEEDGRCIRAISGYATERASFELIWVLRSDDGFDGNGIIYITIGLIVLPR